MSLKTYREHIHQRKKLYAAHGKLVIDKLPGSREASRECMEMVIQYVCQRNPDQFRYDDWAVGRVLEQDPRRQRRPSARVSLPAHSRGLCDHAGRSRDWSLRLARCGVMLGRWLEYQSEDGETVAPNSWSRP
ncbi:hypothetical protein V8E55_011375 [Tylopilus felleus]